MKQGRGFLSQLFSLVDSLMARQVSEIPSVAIFNARRGTQPEITAAAGNDCILIGMISY